MKLLNVDIYSSGINSGLGGITAQNSTAGNIIGCIVSGKIKNETINGATGGITSWSSGKIKDSINKASVYSSAIEEVGGICSGNSVATVIENCVNMGDIIGNHNNEDKKQYIGGIIGVLQHEGIHVKNCYNIGNVSSIKNNVDIGGIAGYVLTSELIHCYNIGDVQGNTGNENNCIGNVVGRVNNGIVNNSYYLINNKLTGIGTGIEEIEGMAKTEAEMKDSTFIDLLNNENANMWKQDRNNINKGYPILAWQ